MTKNSSQPSDVSEIEETQEPTNDWQDKYVRALADYQNLVRQHQKDRLEYVRFATQSLISELLPVYDSLELAAHHSQDQGVVMSVKQLKNLLQNHGLKFIEPKVGDDFDPLQHECIEVKSDSQLPDETIISVSQLGAAWQEGQVIRPAKVVVNRPTKTPVDSN